jgi:uncharacterized protein YecT (DUF1311 family)
MKIHNVILGTFFLLSIAGNIDAASFDCGKATSDIEKIICSNEELSKLDESLNKAYLKALERPDIRKQMIESQKQWLKNERNACKNAECLKKTYETRIKELGLSSYGIVIENPPKPTATPPKAPPEGSESQLTEPAGKAIETEPGQEHDSSPSDYVVRFDRQMQQLTVAESRFMPAIGFRGSERGVSEFRVDPATLTKSGGTEDQPLQLPAGRKDYKVRLGRALYRVVVEPHIFNPRVMGECGAADPVISLSISRDGKPLFSKLSFQDCRTGRTIHRIQVNEPANSIKVLALLDPLFLPIRVERTFPLTSFPEEWEKAIFEDLPTGDIDADLFIAVFKRDISAIHRAIGQGANVNATDMYRFPPLALLGNGREAAYRNRTLEEFDHHSENIAKVLFSAGASGRAENRDGMTLLDHLIGKVPPTVIDLILANGASAREGYPLDNAVRWGDANLAKRLIHKGADPNRKGPDRTTPLRTASISGFYIWGDRDTPPISDYAECVKLLLTKGATVRDAVPDQEGLLWFLVRDFGKDQRVKIVLTELIPYTDQAGIERAQKLAAKIANKNEAYVSLAQWLKKYVGN